MTALQYVYGICKTLLKENKPAEELCELILTKHQLHPNSSITERKEILQLISLVRKEVLIHSKNKIELLSKLKTRISV
jgi:hypothetical protein